MRMPRMDGATFLARARSIAPQRRAHPADRPDRSAIGDCRGQRGTGAEVPEQALPAAGSACGGGNRDRALPPGQRRQHRPAPHADARRSPARIRSPDSPAAAVSCRAGARSAPMPDGDDEQRARARCCSSISRIWMTSMPYKVICRRSGTAGHRAPAARALHRRRCASDAGATRSSRYCSRAISPMKPLCLPAPMR